MEARLDKLTPGMPILVGGDRIVHVSEELAEKFQPGDQLIAVRKTGEILHIPKVVHDLVSSAVLKAVEAFEAMLGVADQQITEFYTRFADRLADDVVWARIASVNQTDVARAKEKGRSTTRLVADEKMRRRMIEGLGQWRDLPSSRDKVASTVKHEGWTVDRVLSPVGVVAFVFEGRPNVLADATGVLRSGNTAVFRIGSDALETAKAIMTHALNPALAASGLHPNAATLLESAQHSAGWALFANSSLALAVARGTGRTVDLLGALARETGNAVSLHGTGGAWLIADETADPTRFERAVYHSIDRKVCNTLNVLCIARSRADELVPRMLKALDERGKGYRLHIAEGSEDIIPHELYNTETSVHRATGVQHELIATVWPHNQLGHEWEWEQTPEFTVVAIAGLDEGIRLFNSQSPLLEACLVSKDSSAHERFLREINAPFIGDGMTRWVDGQFALCRPELGISNWQNGRLLAREGILTGDGVFTIKLRARIQDPEVHQ